MKVRAATLVALLDDVAAEADSAADDLRNDGEIDIEDVGDKLDAVFDSIGNLRGMMEDAQAPKSGISLFRAMTIFCDTLPIAAGAKVISTSFSPQRSGPGLRLNVLYTVGDRAAGRLFSVVSEADVVNAALMVKAEVLA